MTHVRISGSLWPPWQADGRLHVNDTSYEVTSNCGAGQATGKVRRCPEKLGQCKGDDPFRLAYFNSPSPKCWPGGGLHHSLSSTWSKHPTQDTYSRRGTAEREIQMWMWRSALCLSCNQHKYSQPSHSWWTEYAAYSANILYMCTR